MTQACAQQPVIELRPYQAEAVDAVYEHLRTRDDNPCVVLPTGCHAEGHPILMFDGMVKPVEDVVVGDMLMGPDSQPRRVEALCRGEDEMYRITPHKGEPFIVNSDHVLSLVCTNEGKRDFACYRRGGEIDNATVRQYLEQSRYWRHLRKLRHVPVEFSHRPLLPIPPYILGLLLGDGSFVDETINLTTADSEIADAWIDYAHSINCGVTVKQSGDKCPTYRIVKDTGRANIFAEAISALGLMGKHSGEKFIPHVYLTATRHERLQLLAGLMDSDGSSTKSGCDYVTQSRELATDLMFLVRSLGFAAHCTQKYCSCQTGAGGWFFRLSIWGDFEDVPCRLARRQPQRRKQKKDVLRTGFKVESVGRGQFYGFTLDGDHLYVDGHFMVHHNSGKTPVISKICSDAVKNWDGRVLILAHVKELIEQAVDKLHAMAPDLWHQIGCYSAGLKSRDTDHAIIVAGIQSVYRKAAELDRFDLVLIDEAHMLPPNGEGMYQQFIKEARIVNPNVRLIGLTATPYRMTSGTICGTDNLLNHVCYEVGVRELIAQGYLCPLKTKAGRRKADTSGLHVRAGEFIAGEVEALMDDDALVHSACREIVEQTKDRHSVLIFAASVQHAQHVQRVLSEMGHECGFVCGDSSGIFRDDILRRFKEGDLKFLVNVNVLTTGFDAPNIDCVALLRPTNSPGLYYQMCLDMETEVLTENGWSKCDQVRRGDRVASFDMTSGRIEWCKALEKVHRPLAPGETMYGIKSPHLDIRVTDHHDMVYQGRSKSCSSWRKREAIELTKLKDSFYIPVAGENDGPGLPLTDDEIRFIGWQLTDGYTNPHNQTIVITQSARSPHNKSIRSMLDGCGFGYRVYRQKRKGKLEKYADSLTYVVPYGKPRGGNKGKRGWKHLAKYFLSSLRVSLRDISQRQLEVLLQAMNLGDGQKTKTTTWKSRTINLCLGQHNVLVDELQTLLIQRGYRCNVSTQCIKTDWHSGDAKKQYILRIRRQTKSTIGGQTQYANSLIKSRSQFGPVPFSPSEMVWCLKTQYGTLVTRRNGKVAIVGNCGRGFRLHPNKTNCLVLDFGGNILRHGPVDALQIKDKADRKGNNEAPAKECPNCQALIHASYSVCPDCGHEFPPPERDKHDGSASTAGVLSGEVTETDYDVSSVYYSIHTKRGAPPEHPKTLRVDYRCGFNEYHSEWICVAHPKGSYAWQKASTWWQARSSEPMPDTVEQAVELAENGALAQPLSITVRSVTGEKFDRITHYELGAIPTAVAASNAPDEPDYNWPDDDDIPF